MRAETKRKLDRILWRARLTKVAIGIAVLAAIGIGFVLTGLDAKVEDKRVAGVVARVSPFSAKSVSDAVVADIKLTAGGRANVIVSHVTGLHVGDLIEVTEHRHRTGRVTYTWK